MKRFKFYKQLDSMDCGPACLRMVTAYHGKFYSLPYLREKCYIDRAGVSLKGIAEAAESIGFRTIPVQIPFKDKEQLPSLLEAPLPVIVHWNQNHFVVVYEITKRHVYVADPASGKFKLTHDEFLKSWRSAEEKGIALLLEAAEDFHDIESDEENKKGLTFLFRYLKPHKKLMVQLIIGLMVGTVFQLIFPFLTQSLVDKGIDNKDLDFIYIILIAQLMLFLSQMSLRFIQAWQLLHISIRINVSLISDFLRKLMKLPLGFFDSKNTGDLLQRIGDHRRIETFLTKSSLSLVLSVVNIVVFGAVLAIYSTQIFMIFLVSSVLYVLWIVIFLKKRKEIDYKAFQQLSDNQDSLIEIIQGMPEIKLQGSQVKRRVKWTGIQAKLFRVQMSSLAITQYQDIGALFITQLKDIIITFIAAKGVLEGNMTFGMLLAIQYIIGQLNGPLQQMIGFVRAAQDAKISLERLGEIHNSENEELEDENRMRLIPDGDIVIEDLSFSYTKISDRVLDKVSITIPRGKTTAIVGTSGSGKTTLVKLLLGFYAPSRGRIMIGSVPLSSIHMDYWRSKCGAVLQESFVFSDSIARNISESDDKVDLVRVIDAAQKANIMDFVEDLPLGMSTMIGAKGNGISMGQKQRLFIARAIYKDPEFLFFDEATNSLDANNERVIMENLDEFMKDRTAIVVAHRLSTVRNADQIIVLEKGKVVETGTHKELVELKGAYFTLVKNQLELGN